MRVHHEASLKSVGFSIYDPTEVKKLAVCKISNTKRSGDGSIYDLKMGPIDSTESCLTCKLPSLTCSGHFGYIELAQPIFHPLFFSRLESVLKITCVNCYKCLFSEIAPVLNLSKIPSIRFGQLLAKIKKYNYCTNKGCELEQPEIKVNSTDQFIFFNNVSMTPSQIYFLLTNITPVEKKIMGVECNLRGLVIFNLLVLPTSARPILQTENLVCDDDLTMQYLDLLKINNDLGAEIAKNSLKIPQLFSTLKYRIAVMFNNSTTTARYNINLRPFKSIYERLTGKKGHIRTHGMSKRAEKTARSVISPDPTLRLHELVVPEEIAQVLTIPQIVAPCNLDLARQMFYDDKITVIKKKDTEFQIDARKYKQLKGGIIEVGDIYWRNLQNGDWVLFNRQPTLHAPSMQAMEVRTCPQKTFKMNLSNCQVYNADYDGDEMNIHVPQTIQAIVEMKLLSSPRNWLVSEAHGGVNFGLAQDALLAVYLLSRDDNLILKEDWFNLWFASNSKIPYIEPLKFTPQWLINSLFPPNLNYSSKHIQIRNSQIVDGAFVKAEIGYGSRGILIFLYKNYGPQTLIDFLESMQFLGVAWLAYRGYTIGLRDCKSLSETKSIKSTFVNNDSVEEYCNQVGYIVRQSTKNTNNICNLIEAGSKGNWINLVQINGIVGQQYLFGRKVVPVFEGKTLEETGFISNCYYDGLTPLEYWSHLIAARDAICKTATGTAETGYLQRKLIKTNEFAIAQYDGSVRAGKKILLFPSTPHGGCAHGGCAPSTPATPSAAPPATLKRDATMAVAPPATKQ